MNNSYLYVDMSILRQNLESIASSLPAECSIVPVLKDDAYGLGLCPVAAVLSEFDRVRCFAVAHVSEGLALRAAGITKDVLVMGSPLPFQLESAILTKLSLCAASAESVRLIDECAGKLGMEAKIQIKLDIGLHRIGLDFGEELDSFIEVLKGCENLRCCGVFSHFSHAGNDELCAEQFELFEKGIAKLDAAGINTHPRHISCSASSELYPQYAMDAVRLGRRLYMDNPDNPRGDVRELASLRSYVTSVKARKAGDSLGYGSEFFLDRDTTVATVGVGYGDGLDLRLFEKGEKVLINGVSCRLLRCCMDQCMVDVSGVDCSVGDEVSFFGYDGKGSYISVQELAMRIGANEGCALTSALSTRVARVYGE